MYVGINKNPSKDGTYLVKFYNKTMPEYDCTETAWREFKDGKWIDPFYSHPNDGYELVGWYDNE